MESKTCLGERFLDLFLLDLLGTRRDISRLFALIVTLIVAFFAKVLGAERERERGGKGKQ